MGETCQKMLQDLFHKAVDRAEQEVLASLEDLGLLEGHEDSDAPEGHRR